ncbi:hypothetical protein [Deinococcus hopiensis]|uniref:Bacterial Pleckstrin homology domain-containing protein n=1 Tax=Deinococcus hopiensis KR-140 TaxID=695939 RepID=A0A1W1UWK3_9DEIO|nr:hypothetical protein [Deinococcus hopiensis]SMB85545.1 hypothetical protein SAMN00790413_03439 [Deinococcus hopiensis KR-140]
MITLTFGPNTLILDVMGLDRLWSLKSHLELPLSHIQQVRVEEQAAIPWKEGLRAPGTHLPGVLAAGTFYTHGRKVFADIREGQPALVLELHHESYDQLIFQTDDLQADLLRIREALPS